MIYGIRPQRACLADFSNKHEFTPIILLRLIPAYGVDLQLFGFRGHELSVNARSCERTHTIPGQMDWMLLGLGFGGQMGLLDCRLELWSRQYGCFEKFYDLPPEFIFSNVSQLSLSACRGYHWQLPWEYRVQLQSGSPHCNRLGTHVLTEALTRISLFLTGEAYSSDEYILI